MKVGNCYNLILEHGRIGIRASWPGICISCRAPFCLSRHAMPLGVFAFQGLSCVIGVHLDQRARILFDMLCMG